MDMETVYLTWTNKELRDELKRRGGIITGKKADLIDRLETFDRNSTFGNPSQAIDAPPAELYQDVNSSTVLPKITKHLIQDYFDRFSKNIRNAVGLYESRNLLDLQSTTFNHDTYLKGFCKASKQLQYEINVKINKDGMPLEASCDCAAGEGKEAHCEHVAVALLAAENIVRDKIILLHEDTTLLPIFHKQSKKTTTPLKAYKFVRDKHNTVFSPYLEHHPNFDKKAYQARFRSLIENYPDSTMPFKQLYPPSKLTKQEKQETFSDPLN